MVYIQYIYIKYVDDDRQSPWDCNRRILVCSAFRTNAINPPGGGCILRPWEQLLYSFTSKRKRQNQTDKAVLVDLTQGGEVRRGQRMEMLHPLGRGWAVCAGSGLCRAVLPCQLTHHLQQSLVLLFELLILFFNVIQVLQEGKTHILELETFSHMNIQEPVCKTLRGLVR